MRTTFWLKIGATSVVSLVLLGLALRHVDVHLLGRFLVRANYGYVGAAVVMYFVDLGFRCMRWRVLLSVARDISVRRLYPVLAIGYMGNNLLPARIGELSRAYLVGQRENVSPSTVLASVALERVIDGLTVLLLLLATLPALPGAAWLGSLTTVAAGFIGAAIVACFVLAVAQPSWVEVAARLLGVLPESLRRRAVDALDRFVLGFSVLRDVRQLGQTLVISVIIWVVGATTYVLVAHAFGVRLSIVDALAAICVVNLATAVPLAPAGLGAFEVAALAIFSLVGIDGTTAAGITIVLHAVLFVPIVVVGLLFLWRLNLSVETLWDDSRRTTVSAALEQAG